MVRNPGWPCRRLIRSFYTKPLAIAGYRNHFLPLPKCGLERRKKCTAFVMQKEPKPKPIQCERMSDRNRSPFLATVCYPHAPTGIRVCGLALAVRIVLSFLVAKTNLIDGVFPQSESLPLRRRELGKAPAARPTRQPYCVMTITSLSSPRPRLWRPESSLRRTCVTIEKQPHTV